MSALYTIFIYPLELFFEVVFSIANRIVNNPGWAIIVLSLAVNFLVLPLYNRADEVQKQERELEKSIEPGITKIKNAFNGDERMMMLQAFYRENNYSPLYVLKGSVSLLLQIPFFMAAYRFLSNLAALNGAGFGLIHDLGTPDAMIPLGAISINVLPILMTLINFISGYIYTRGMPLKSKIQLYGMAILFLVLLYNSPSGLAFYWTLNNVFSMVKNIFYRLKKPGKVLSVISASIGVVALIYINVFYSTPYVSRKVRLSILALLLLVPFVISLIRQKVPQKGLIRIPEYKKSDMHLFLISNIFMSLLTGLLIPSSVVKASPFEFMDIMNLKNPVIYIWHSLFIAIGFFIVWCGVFFVLANEKVRVVLSRIWITLGPASVVTYLFFGTDLGNISVNFVYDMPFRFSMTIRIINLVLVLAVATGVIFLCRFSSKICEIVVITLSFVALIMGIMNLLPIYSAYKENLNRVQSEYPRITLSSTGENVMVIMLDRAPGFVVPIIFDEHPELYEQFDGFTYYPNTISFGSSTKFASAALFGGYEYTPEAINADPTKTLVQSQNEALCLMPILFERQGFEVTVMDPPYAGCVTPGDLSIFEANGCGEISAYHAKGIVVDNYYKFEEYQERIWYRNFFCYSIFKISPLFIQDSLYNEGRYNQPESALTYETDFTLPQVGFSESISSGVNSDFMSAYETLTKLSDITEITDAAGGTFMYMDNDTAHDALLLQAPDYIPLQYVDNTEYDMNHAYRFSEPVNGYMLNMDNYMSMKHYESNAAAYIQLGIYFDYLKQMGVWDNTRIIIVSDHGIMREYADMFGGQLNIENANIDSFNPVLMVKDFGSTGFNTDVSFMTNADVPYIATCGIIDDPVNPFTGHPIIQDHSMPIYAFNSDWSGAGSDATAFGEDDVYVFNGDNVFDIDSWEFDGTR